MKHIEFFNEFLNDEVNLNPTLLRRLDGHVKAVTEFLSKNLDSYRRVERQGSYALRTIIKPVKEGQEYDADLLLYMSYDGGKGPKDYIEALYDCFMSTGTYREMAHRRTRCVTLDYAGDVHLDVVPCIDIPNDSQFICNNKTNAFEATDGTGYRDWFNGQTRITHGNLKRVTRLLKFLRDHKGNFAAKSILLTTLIGNTVDSEQDGENFKTVPDALKTVSNRLNEFLQANAFMPAIRNPALPSEDFTRHWTQENYTNFRKQFDVYNGRINDAFDEPRHDDSIDEWRKVFGDKFGRKTNSGGQHESGQARVASTVAVTPRKPWACSI